VIVLTCDCDPIAAESKELPSDSYLVSYKIDDELKYDIVQGFLVEVFDHYYDKYKNVNGIDWTSGNISPKTFNYIPKLANKKRR